MKKLFLILFIFASLHAISQTQYGSHTLFQTNDTNVVNGYISFDGSLTKINDYTVGAIGGTIGATANHSFTFGLTGSFILDSKQDNTYVYEKPLGYENSTLRKYCGYGGILLEPTLFPKFPFHLTFPCVVGVGGITYALQDDNYWTSYDYILEKTWFFIFTAGARLEFNLIDGMRISGGPSYHYVPNLELKGAENDIMNGFYLDFSIKVGKY